MMKHLAILVAALWATPNLAQTPSPSVPPAPLKIEVMRSGPGSLLANFTLIQGTKDAVLIDAPFTMADAHRLVAMILDSGKRLTHVYVTHDHPDHFFAMEVIQDAFPDAVIVANPTVVADIWKSLPHKVKRWGPVLGGNGPRHPTAPTPLVGDTILLEGRELKVIGPMPGDHAHATAIWVPSIKTLIAGDLAFDQTFLWFGEHKPADIAAWGKSLDKLAELKPEVVVAGHSKPGLPDDSSGLDYSRRYISAWPKLVALSKDSADLRARVQASFPQAVDVLGDFLLGNSSRVAMGEQAPWQE